MSTYISGLKRQNICTHFMQLIPHHRSCIFPHIEATNAINIPLATIVDPNYSAFYVFRFRHLHFDIISEIMFFDTHEYLRYYSNFRIVFIMISQLTIVGTYIIANIQRSKPIFCRTFSTKFLPCKVIYRHLNLIGIRRYSSIYYNSL